MHSQPSSEVQRNTAIPKLRTTPELGPEKFCTRCREWWPADPEFFYPAKAGAAGLFYCCKACYREWLTARRASLKEVPTHV